MRGSFRISPESHSRMASPDTWTLADARERVKTPTWLQSHRLFAEGDHLQAGTGAESALAIPGLLPSVLPGWIAPMPPRGYEFFRNHYDGVVRGFVSANKVGEVQWRHTAGVVGRQPSRGFESRAPIPKGKEMTPELLRLKEEADAWMAARWEAEGMHGSLQKAIAALLYASRQPARMVLPRAYLTDGGGVPRLPLDEMLKLLRLTYPNPEECTVWTDPDTFEETGIFLYKQDEEDRAEVTWVDRASGLTHVRQIGVNSGTVDEVVWDFGGMIPMFEMRRAPLITPQIIQNQKALNLALSSVPANVYSAMMRTRTLMNVDPETEEVVENGETKLVPKVMEWGRGIINFLSGYPIYDKDKSPIDKNGDHLPVGYEAPSMEVEEPVEIRPSGEAVAIHERQIFSEARQLHALMSADAVASGISRIVARVEFMGSLTETKPTADACIEWEMNTRLAMGEAFAVGREGVRLTDGQRVYSRNLRANAECKLDPGPITPEERVALDQMVQSGRLSDETALALMGVEDVAEEKARKDRENRAKNAFTMIAQADEAGMDRFAVLTILGGFTPEEARALARGDVTAGGLTQ